MKLYGKKYAQKYVDSRAARGTETRDAVLWTVDDGNYRCTVKIQGSPELILAHYPRNWKSQPYWLKPGNAVRILHRSGVRGYVEVIGEGRAIPIPVEGAVMPPAPSLPDMILSGLKMTATTPESMGVIISAGTFRIAGVVYTYTGGLTGDASLMDDPAPMTLGVGSNYMGTVLHTETLDAAPGAGYYRYDAFVIGANAEVDYIKGSSASTNPVAPAIPTSHLKIGDNILIRGGATAIYTYDIGAKWAYQRPTLLSVTPQYPNGFPYSQSDSTPEETITVSVKDQYGATLATSANGYTIILQKLYGIGQLWSSQTGYHDSLVRGTCSASYVFKYQRNQALDADTPTVGLMATLESDSGVVGMAIITLLY